MTESSRRGLRLLARSAPAIVLLGIAVWGVRQPIQSATPNPVPPFGTPMAPQSLSGAHAVGDQAAPVGLILYSDFECPYCATLAADVLPTIRREYVDRGLLRVGFRHFPMSALHPGADKISSFVECASLQVDFWTVHDLVLANPTQLDPSRRMRLFENRRLDEQAFASCISGPSVAVQEDVAHGKAIGVRSTPALLLGPQERGAIRVTKVFDGLVSSRTLADAIDHILAGQIR